MGWYHNFPQKIFSHTVPRNFVGEQFFISKISLHGKKYEKEVYITIFFQKFSVLQCRKISWWNSLVFQKKSGMEEKHKKNGGIMIFCREFSASHTEKIRGAIFCY